MLWTGTDSGASEEKEKANLSKGVNCDGASFTASGSSSLQPMYKAAMRSAMISARRKYRIVMTTARESDMSSGQQN